MFNTGTARGGSLEAGIKENLPANIMRPDQFSKTNNGKDQGEGRVSGGMSAGERERVTMSATETKQKLIKHVILSTPVRPTDI